MHRVTGTKNGAPEGAPLSLTVWLYQFAASSLGKRNVQSIPPWLR